MKNSFYFLIVIFFASCSFDHEVVKDNSIKQQEKSLLLPRSTAPCDNPSYNCTDLKIRLKRFYRTSQTNLNCCPLQSPIFIIFKNTYYNYSGAACEPATFIGSIARDAVQWTDLPCQAIYEHCSYCSKFEFLVRWCGTTVFNYAMEFEVDGPCGIQTFGVCNLNGPTSCSYRPEISGSSYIFDNAVFYYELDENCCFEQSSECESTNCAASNGNDCPINYECNPEQ